jgi:ketosteroid isomerase-like protein
MFFAKTKIINRLLAKVNWTGGFSPFLPENERLTPKGCFAKSFLRYIYKGSNLFFAASIILLTACNTAGKVTATPTPDRSPDVRADIEKYNQCFSQMNADCIASLFASSGEIYDTGLLQASGPNAVRSYLNQSFSAARLDSFSATVDSIVINGNVGVATGTYNEKLTDAANQSYELKLRYVAEWIYQSNGQWLLNRLSTVMLPPPSPTPTGTP